MLAWLSAALAARAARASGGSGGSPGALTSAGAGSAVSGTCAAVGAVSTGAGSVVIVAPQSPVSVPVPEPPSAAKPGQLVLGGIPGELQPDIGNRRNYTGAGTRPSLRTSNTSGATFTEFSFT